MLHEKLLITEEYRALNQLEKVALPLGQFIPNIYKRGITHVGFGEDHGSEFLHKSVSSLIPFLKEHNVEIICLELNYQMQTHIDRFQLTGDEKSLQEVINEETKHLKLNLPVEGRVETAAYFDIIRNATKSGIRVLAIDDVFLEKISERDSLMSENVPRDKRVFVYAGQIHLSGKYVYFGGVPKFLLERGVDMYVVRQIFKSHGSDEILKRHASSRRFLEIVKMSSVLSSMGSFGFDIRFNKDTYKVIRELFPGKNPEYFGDGFVFHQDKI